MVYYHNFIQILYNYTKQQGGYFIVVVNHHNIQLLSIVDRFMIVTLSFNSKMDLPNLETTGDFSFIKIKLYNNVSMLAIVKFHYFL